MKLNDEGPSNAAHWHKRATEAEAEAAQARQTAEYWKAEHLAGNVRIGELHDELAATALRSADHLRKAIKYETRADELRAVLRELVALEDMRLRLRQLHEMGHGTDYADYHRLLPLAWDEARLVLGPNVRAKAATTAAQEYANGTK
jgi:hypothetical protein